MPVFLSDSYVFPLLQGLLLLLLIFVLVMELTERLRAGSGGTTLSITRGERSMGVFYGIYAAVSGVLVALCLSADWAANHRVFWLLVDTLVASYLCLVNPWFRNRLLAPSNWQSKIESR